MANSVSFTRGSMIQWEVGNALLLNHLKSKEFFLGESRCRLHLTQGVSGCMTVSLNKLNTGKLTRRYKVLSFVKIGSTIPINTQEYVLDDPYFTTEEIWRISNVMTRNLQDVYLTRGILTFIISFMPETAPETVTTSKKERSSEASLNETTVATWENNRSLDFQQLMDGGVPSDVTLKCVERSFPAHKTVLSARSEVFAAMFRSDTADRTGVVQISGMEDSILDQFLHRIYSGKLPDLSADNVRELCVAADKYRTEFLKNACLKFIEKNLTRENACEMLIFADANGFEDLKDSVMRFIMTVELPRHHECRIITPA